MRGSRLLLVPSKRRLRIVACAYRKRLVAVGARVIEGRGSRVRFERDGEVETFHRPRPAKEAKRYQVRAARDFLQRTGVKP